MHDPEFGHIQFDDAKLTASHGHRHPLLIAFVATMSLWMALGTLPVRRFTCAACRLDRFERVFLRFRWSTYRECQCSRWYAANVEATHAHVWRKLGDPIAGFSQSLQMRIYQRFRDPLAAKPLFLQLGRWNEGNGRLQEGLTEWLHSDSTESWDEWWAKHRDE